MSFLPKGRLIVRYGRSTALRLPPREGPLPERPELAFTKTTPYANLRTPGFQHPAARLSASGSGQRACSLEAKFDPNVRASGLDAVQADLGAAQRRAERAEAEAALARQLLAELRMGPPERDGGGRQRKARSPTPTESEAPGEKQDERKTTSKARQLAS